MDNFKCEEKRDIMKTLLDVNKKRNNLLLTIWISFCLIGIMYLAVTGFIFLVINNTTTTSAKYTYDIDTLTQTLDLITTNCGSTYIVKRYGDTKYYVFTNITRPDGYSKYEYELLSDCLGGK